ncbi:hypothetical protein QG37_07597 [Candidozyma auris]|uniref:Uncharacterized protein n=1 Tax=Candidozyma auris TaxID=498019 RepID=A0A0L0NR10_CANAR|nr:hypothetical protein QG37_07597 [[Candida] auris]
MKMKNFAKHVNAKKAKMAIVMIKPTKILLW